MSDSDREPNPDYVTQLPAWAKKYEKEYNLHHYQEREFIECLTDLKKHLDAGKEGAKECIEKLCQGYYAYFDERQAICDPMVALRTDVSKYQLHDVVRKTATKAYHHEYVHDKDVHML